MLISIVEFEVSPDDRPKAMAFLEKEAHSVREICGNIAYVPMVRGEGGEIMLLQEWEDTVAFAAFKETDVFAVSGNFLGPMMCGAPRSRAFLAELVTT